MFGLGVPELILILIIGLIVFGPGKLPTIGSALGKSLREFKDAMNAPSSTKDTPPAAQNTVQEAQHSNHAAMEAAAKEAVQHAKEQPAAAPDVTASTVTPPEKNA